MSEKSKSSISYSLEDAIGFDDQDLAANAIGKLSERQQKKLRMQRTKLAVFIAVLTVSCTSIGVCELVLTSLGANNTRTSPQSCVFVGIILSLFFTLVAIRLNSYNAIRRSPVSAVTGYVMLDIADNMKSARYSISLGDTHFYVQKPIFLAFKNGDPYRIYYALGSNTILSAEWLRGE